MTSRTRRRRFSADYKHRILSEADACTEPGALTKLLQGEGLRASHLHSWRAARERGILAGLEPKKRGPKPLLEEDKKTVALEQALAAALERARRAEHMVAVQTKKLRAGLGHVREGKPEVIELVREAAAFVGVRGACEALGISRASYYRWIRRERAAKPRSEADHREGEVCRRSPARS